MGDSQNQGGFKLIGIVPLEGCNIKFLKNLKIGTAYLFHNNYEINLNEDNKTIKNVIVNQSSVPTTMYNLQNGIKVNVSAVVGANGSGKSALIELFYYFVYAISSLNGSNLEFKKYSELIKYEIDELKSDIQKLVNERKKFHVSINIQNKYNIKVHLKNQKSDYNLLLSQLLDDKLHFTNTRLNEATEIDKLIDTSLNLSVIYEINEEVFVTEYIKGKLTLKNKDGEEAKSSFNFKNFFYSICLNYSHHSLNSKIIGEWINSLFHKNDGYKTSVVINPMRNDGMYDINHELNLSKERLMFNLAYFLLDSQGKEKEYKLLDKYRVNSVDFSIKSSSYPFPMGFTTESLEELSSYFLIKDFIDESNSTRIKHLEIAVGYLERKIKKIKKNYSDIIFKNFHESEEEKVKYFENFITEDNSHITKKINQVVNYLRYAANNPSPEISPLFNLEILQSISFNSQDFIAFIQKNKELSLGKKSTSLNVLEIMNYLPPSIFNIDFKLELDNNESILLSELSSGEQQMVFNTNTILYHLYNLQSAFSHNMVRLVYENVSIVLDEIELYYHPEMQRQFLKNLLNSLELVKSKNIHGIKSINILFLTHSPFILSDIPSQNILKLMDGKPKSTDVINSFAANIYDLLKDEFFLKNGAIGAFAIDLINKILKKDVIAQEDIDIINLIGDPFLKGLIKKKNEDKISDDLLEKEINRLLKYKQKRSDNATN